VDVFFVISGFLITNIVKSELDAGTFSFRHFWAGRVRRILPAMIAVTVTALVVAKLFVFGPDQPEIGKQAIAALLSLANVYFWQSTGDYWGPNAEEAPFLHTWSLSVEEQFYLLFPLAVWLLYRVNRRWLTPFVVIRTLVSFGLRQSSVVG
jgi:peptidoglycan/LPS O-acetylase OafA/YrhL